MGAPGSWLQPGPAPAGAVILGTGKWTEDLSIVLCFSASQTPPHHQKGKGTGRIENARETAMLILAERRAGGRSRKNSSRSVPELLAELCVPGQEPQFSGP